MEGEQGVGAKPRRWDLRQQVATKNQGRRRENGAGWRETGREEGSLCLPAGGFRARALGMSAGWRGRLWFPLDPRG